jgi:hypothetical protein
VPQLEGVLANREPDFANYSLPREIDCQLGAMSDYGAKAPPKRGFR